MIRVSIGSVGLGSLGVSDTPEKKFVNVLAVDRVVVYSRDIKREEVTKMATITDKLQYVCDTLDWVIDDDVEREQLSEFITKAIDANWNNDKLAEILATQYSIELPKDRWNVWA